MHKVLVFVILGIFFFLFMIGSPRVEARTACIDVQCPLAVSECPGGLAKDSSGCNTCACATSLTPTVRPSSTLVPTSGAPSFAPANCPVQPYGDATCNGVVDSDDQVAWKNVYLKLPFNTRFNPDFNHDGKVTLIDLEIWVRNIGRTQSENTTITVSPSGIVSSAPTAIVSVTRAPVPTDVPEPTETPMPSNTPGPSPTLIPVSGLTYYISPSGSDSNNGTSLTSPFKTFAKAFPLLKPGDLLYMRDGVYAENVKSVKTNPGTASAKITVKNYGNERPVIQGLFWMSGASYWVFDGINITWGSGLTSGDHMVKFTGEAVGWELKNCEIWGARSFAAISITGFTKNWNINHCYIHDTYKSNDTNQDHLIYSNDASYGVIERNVFTNSENGRGVKLGPPSGGGAGPNNIIVRYNTFYNNTGPANIQVSGGTSNNVFERNILVKPQTGQSNITVNSGYFGTNSVAKNNLGYESAGMLESGIVDGGGNVTNVNPQINFNVAKRSDGSYIIDNTSFRPVNSAAQSYGAFAP